jgi:hypothetical protein
VKSNIVRSSSREMVQEPPGCVRAIRVRSTSS